MNRPVRIPHAQRRATTRAKVIEAAINCLYRFGYSATGLVLVAKDAGVSRGAMSQQFPTKADLMIALVQDVFDKEAGEFIRAAEELSPEKWVRSLPAMMWKSLSKPSGTAVMEIMLAVRSDEELAIKFREIHADIDARSKAYVIRQLIAAGIPVPPNIDVVQHVMTAVIRGLVLETVYINNRKASERAVDLVDRLFRVMLPSAGEQSL